MKQLHKLPQDLLSQGIGGLHGGGPEACKHCGLILVFLTLLEVLKKENVKSKVKIFST